MMDDGPSQRLDRMARSLIPTLLSLFLVMLSTIPFYIPAYGQIAANWVLMAVFYWAVYRPELMPNSVAFLLGLFLDILVGAPPGINALVLVLVRAVVVNQSRAFRGKSFLVLWWGFGVLAAMAAGLIWLLSSAYHLQPLPPAAVALQAVLTVSLFPFLVWVQGRIHHAVL